MNIELGDKVRDRVTGFEGIVVATSKWAHNADSVGIQKQEIFNGKVDECLWIDVTPRLELIEKGFLSDIVVPAEKHDFNLLDEAQDTITPFKGKIVCFTTWSSGCVRACLCSDKLDKDSKSVEMWLPVSQIVKTKTAEQEVSNKRGGPMNHPVCY